MAYIKYQAAELEIYSYCWIDQMHESGINYIEPLVLLFHQSNCVGTTPISVTLKKALYKWFRSSKSGTTHMRLLTAKLKWIKLFGSQARQTYKKFSLGAH